MKALTLMQPWATLVAIGAKKIETRSWPTKYRGPLAIHASKRFPKEFKRLLGEEPFFSVLYKAGYANPINHALGAIIAICQLIEVWENNDPFLMPISSQERAFGDYRPGRYMWLLKDIKKLDKPISIKGSLGLWEWKEENHDRT